jgi:inorganic pyrophosphatase
LIEYRIRKRIINMGLKQPGDTFWNALDSLVRNSEIVIDRPKGSHHPRFPEIVYPVDYGYLKNTTAMDGKGIDVWRGTDTSRKIDAIVCTVDLNKKDSEIKILIGCCHAEKKLILQFYNQGVMKGLLIQR